MSKINNILRIKEHLPERKSGIELEISRSRNRFERLLQAASDGILIIGEDGIIQHLNSQLTEIVGYKKKELLGQPVEYLIPESQKKDLVKLRKQYQQNSHKRSMRCGLELYAKHKNGSRVPVDIKLEPLDEGMERNTIAIIRDVSKFKEMQKRVEREEGFIKLLNKLTTIANQNINLTQTLDESVRVICEYMCWDVGHVYCLADDESQEFYPTDIWYIENEDKFQSFKRMMMETSFNPGMGMVGEVIDSGEPQWYANAHENPGFVHRMPDIDLNIRACFGLPILIRDKVVGVLEFFSDQIVSQGSVLLKKMETIGHQLGRVIERERSESLMKKNTKFFQQLFEHVPVGIVVLDEEKKVIDVNNIFTSIFGYVSEELVGNKIDDLLVSEEFKDNAKDLSRQAFNGELVSKETIRKHKDGTEVPVIIHTVPVIVDDEIEAVFEMYINLLKVKEAEDQLRNSIEEKKFLLQEIHHRVKNNLALITSLLELQIHQAENEIAIKQLKDSRSRIYSMAMVHEHLYQMDSFSYLELDVYLENLVNKINTTFEESDTQIDIDFKTESVKLSLDKAIYCGQLINEIVTNAIKHAFPHTKKGHISISLIHENETIVLEISDNGLGISQKILNGEQSSLGLKLINTLTKQLQGEIEVDGENGTTYRVHFPAEENINHG